MVVPRFWRRECQPLVPVPLRGNNELEKPHTGFSCCGEGSDTVSLTVTGMGGQVPYFSLSFPISLQHPLCKAPSREQRAGLNYGQQAQGQCHGLSVEEWVWS